MEYFRIIQGSSYSRYRRVARFAAFFPEAGAESASVKSTSEALYNQGHLLQGNSLAFYPGPLH